MAAGNDAPATGGVELLGLLGIREAAEVAGLVAGGSDSATGKADVEVAGIKEETGAAGVVDEVVAAGVSDWAETGAPAVTEADATGEPRSAMVSEAVEMVAADTGVTSAGGAGMDIFHTVTFACGTATTLSAALVAASSPDPIAGNCTGSGWALVTWSASPVATNDPINVT